MMNRTFMFLLLPPIVAKGGTEEVAGVHRSIFAAILPLIIHSRPLKGNKIRQFMRNMVVRVTER